MSTPRLRPAAVAFDGKLYVFGGFTEGQSAAGTSEILDSAECFDLATRKWAMLPPMDTPTQGARAFAFESKIYILGGSASRRRVGGSASRQVLAFDPTSETYEVVTEIPEPVADFGIAVVGSVVYLIGGCKDYELADSFLGFDLRQRTWLARLPSLNCARKSCACFYDGRTIWVVGGHDPVKLKYMNSVERLDIDSGEWSWKEVDNFPFGAALDAVQCPMPSSNVAFRYPKLHAHFGYPAKTNTKE